MMGYLQRIASSALRPGGAIRPVSGSIYAGRGPRPGPDSPAVAPDLFAEGPGVSEARPGEAPTPPSRAEPGKRRTTAAADPGKVGAAGQTAPREREEPKGQLPTAPRAEVPVPLVEPKVGRGPAGSRPGREGGIEGRKRVNRAEAPEAASAKDSEGPANLPGEPAGPGEHDSGTRRVEAAQGQPMENAGRAFKPLVDGEFLPAPTRALGPAHAPGPEGRAGRERASRAVAQGAAPGEPDLIQIHIGRIEVVAAQPPPLIRPAAQKTQRKAPSLDEYLRRRNERFH